MIDRQHLYADYEKVKEYAAEVLGYEVLEGSDYVDECDASLKKITICSRTGIEKRLYGLLHECGHALLRKDWGKFYKEYKGRVRGDIDGRRARTDLHKVSTIEEEVEAWKRGKRLAKRLSIGLYEDRFDAHKVECLMTYVRWAS